ncbi:MAG: hypothetical protein QOH39_2899 [Verrucomicrobiota bacterium]
MVVTTLAAWFVGSQKKERRKWGFWLFLFSNVLWVAWGWHDHAYALVISTVGAGDHEISHRLALTNLDFHQLR